METNPSHMNGGRHHLMRMCLIKGSFSLSVFPLTTRTYKVRFQEGTERGGGIIGHKSTSYSF